ncbi:MAG: TIGR03435 family protein [Terriglobales bacterium]
MIEAALLNHLWQSTLFAAAAAVLASLLRHHQARVRFWIWLAASLKFLVPFAAFATLAGWLQTFLPMPAVRAAAAPAAATVSQPFTQLLELGGTLAPAASSHLLAYTLIAVWLAGTVALLVRWRRRWRRLAQADRSVLEPGVHGVFRQRLLLPPDLEARLSPAELAAVLAHEQCHMRRRDNLWSALHMVVEALFWFHPFVWIIGERLVAERERACDEDVLAVCPDRSAYAGAVLAVCRQFVAAPLPCASGIAGGRLAARVRAILAGELGRRLSRSQRVAVAAAMLVAIAGPILLLAAQHPAPPTRFEAATIKPVATPNFSSGRGMIRFGTQRDPQRLTAEGVTLKNLIMDAYGLSSYQVEGPSWISSRRFDVTAVTAVPVSGARLFTLLRPLLAQRFKLRTHQTSRRMRAYELEIAPGGSKLRLPRPGDLALPGAPRGRGPARLQPGMFMVRAGPQQGGALQLTTYTSVGGLAQMLSRQLGTPVADRTGIKGDFVVKLRYAPPPGMRRSMHILGVPPPLAPSGGAAPRHGAAAAPASAPSIFAALQQQLGLKLVANKNAAVTVLVVDHALMIPLGN